MHSKVCNNVGEYYVCVLQWLKQKKKVQGGVLSVTQLTTSSQHKFKYCLYHSVVMWSTTAPRPNVAHASPPSLSFLTDTLQSTQLLTLMICPLTENLSRVNSCLEQ